MVERSAPEVRVLATADAAVPLLLDEIRRVVAAGGRPLVGFATGGTYTAMLKALAVELHAGRIDTRAFTATHLDEYLGFPPERTGGMVHELGSLCAPLLAMLRAGAFLPVPYDGSAASLAVHEARLQRAGGVVLQLLGIGRNGHLAFNEPGTAFDTGFHTTQLAATTRDDARARFAPAEPPLHAVTSGLATILSARRLVLCAFGAHKADAVRAMLRGDVTPQCPASLVQRHGNVLVLLDRAAAGTLGDAVATG
jgi:glucosamine-6-phosphate deaminase